MDINVSVLASLQLIIGHKELAVQPLIQFVENQTTLRSNQGRVRVCVLLITQKTNGLRFLIDLIHNVNEILLEVSVIPVRLRNLRVDLIKNLLHNVVHIRNVNLFRETLSDDSHNLRYNLMVLGIVQLNHCTGGRLTDCIDNLLTVKLLNRAVLLNYFHGV